MVSKKSTLAHILVLARSSNTALERLLKGPPTLRRPFQWNMKKAFEMVDSTLVQHYRVQQKTFTQLVTIQRTEP